MEAPEGPGPHRRTQRALKLLAALGLLSLGLCAGRWFLLTITDSRAENDSYDSYDYDLFTIGGGSAGVRLARFSAKYGARVGLAELPFAVVSDKHSAGGLGGTCVIRGCVPKKLLVYGSQLHDELRDARGYGWDFHGRPRINWRRLIATKNKEVARLSGKYRELLNDAKVDVFEGYAQVLSPHMVSVNGKRVTAKYICVATGSRASVPKIPGSTLPGVLTSDDALNLSHLPRRIVIVGGGYIAMEFASFFYGYGSEVHLVLRADKPLRGFDADVRAHLHSALQQRGIHLHANETPASIERRKLGWGELIFRTDQGTVLEVDNVMFATGRRPNTEELGLEAVGVEVDALSGKILVDKFSRTTVPSIFAIGDVTSRRSLTPVALMEATALSETLFGGRSRAPTYDNVPSAVFSQPPVATCGLSEAEAVDKHGEVQVFMSRFKPLKHTMPTGRAGQEMVLIKVLVANRGRSAGTVVGVHMVGEDAPEIVQALAIALSAGASKEQFDQTVALHPTVTEEFCTLREATRIAKRRQKPKF
ncbi:EMB2360 [Symbiodinium natans]|uniref:EMB2360 protein n=1 Tax=Symbiodinium natans TaxID=878477 RepID=A0A812S9D9_9DINO|nr:EMB2360 [Symbiodinium natans]